MSASKWRWTDECDGDFCPGDCDLCDKNLEDDEETEVDIKKEETILR